LELREPRRHRDLCWRRDYSFALEAVLEVLATHDGVAECAVIGINDETWGERVVAVVVARAGKSLNHEIIEAHLRGKLAGYKMPKETVVIDALPRNAAGKIVKRDLKVHFS
jgi:fatty-acyl-CoA synthase